MRIWRANNPDKARALRHNYKARKRGNGGAYTAEELKELFEKQDGKCLYCGELIYSSFDKELHVDHKTPLVRGGTNDILNIALACSKCNLTKHTKTAEEFLMEA
jgi:5-methylcytosine-specific restriction endonuclease McrA